MRKTFQDIVIRKLGAWKEDWKHFRAPVCKLGNYRQNYKSSPLNGSSIVKSNFLLFIKNNIFNKTITTRNEEQIVVNFVLTRQFLPKMKNTLFARQLPSEIKNIFFCTCTSEAISAKTKLNRECFCINFTEAISTNKITRFLFEYI